MDVIIGGIYKHYKGDYYLVENIAIHTETGEKMVIYRPLYGKDTVYARPYNMFIEKISDENPQYRFQLQNTNNIVKQ